MRADTATDHGDLALLAQTHAAELRPLLLRVQVQNFADAPQRDPGTIASFETIALGLIPLVPDDVLADAARVLRGVPDAPHPVLRALLDRLQFQDDEQPPGVTAAPAVLCPLATARDHGSALDEQTLTELIEVATADPMLAEALLDRPDLTAFDRAALYGQAGDEARARIRHDLADALAAIHLPRPGGGGDAAREVMAVAARRDTDATRIAVAARLGIAPDIFMLDEPAGQELFLFGLLAIGLDLSECVKTFLTLDTPAARSVQTVFRLAELARATPRPVATFLVGYERVGQATGPDERTPPSRGLASLRGNARAEPIPVPSRANRTARDRDPNVRADRRS